MYQFRDIFQSGLRCMEAINELLGDAPPKEITVSFLGDSLGDPCGYIELSALIRAVNKCSQKLDKITLEVNESQFISDDSLRVFKELFTSKQCPTVLSLSFFVSWISGQGLKYLLQEVQQAKQLNSLNIDFSFSLNKQDWDIGCTALAELLASGFLQDLSVGIACNSISDDAIARILRVIANKNCPRKLSLDIAGTDFGRESLKAFIDILNNGVGPEQLFLDLTGIFFSDVKTHLSDFKILTDALMHTIYPGKLILAFNFYRFKNDDSEEIKKLLAEAIQENTSLFLDDFIHCMQYPSPAVEQSLPVIENSSSVLDEKIIKANARNYYIAEHPDYSALILKRWFQAEGVNPKTFVNTPFSLKQLAAFKVIESKQESLACEHLENYLNVTSPMLSINSNSRNNDLPFYGLSKAIINAEAQPIRIKEKSPRLE